jgi:hypothetical protein
MGKLWRKLDWVDLIWVTCVVFPLFCFMTKHGWRWDGVWLFTIVALLQPFLRRRSVQAPEREPAQAPVNISPRAPHVWRHVHIMFPRALDQDMRFVIEQCENCNTVRATSADDLGVLYCLFGQQMATVTCRDAVLMAQYRKDWLGAR